MGNHFNFVPYPTFKREDFIHIIYSNILYQNWMHSNVSYSIPVKLTIYSQEILAFLYYKLLCCNGGGESRCLSLACWNQTQVLQYSGLVQHLHCMLLATTLSVMQRPMENACDTMFLRPWIYLSLRNGKMFSNNEPCVRHFVWCKGVLFKPSSTSVLLNV